MKSLILSVILALALSASARAQNSVIQGTVNALSNGYFDVHYSYEPNAKGHEKNGGGGDLLLPIASTATNSTVYTTVFARLGGQWLAGGFYGISGQVGLETPFQPFRAFASTNTSFAYNFTLAPFAVTGTGSCLSGDKIGGFTIPGKAINGSIVAIEGLGVAAKICNVSKHWDLLAVADAEDWVNIDWIYSAGLMMHKAF